MADKLLDVNASVYTSEKATPRMQAPSPCGGAKAPKAPASKEMDVNKAEYSEEAKSDSGQEDYKAFKM